MRIQGAECGAISEATLGVHCRDQRGMRDALRDVDFSPAHRSRILAATAEDGTCALWHWERGEQVAVMELPPGGNLIALRRLEALPKY